MRVSALATISRKQAHIFTGNSPNQRRTIGGAIFPNATTQGVRSSLEVRRMHDHSSLEEEVDGVGGEYHASSRCFT
jgi:hypothetical protein